MEGNKRKGNKEGKVWMVKKKKTKRKRERERERERIINLNASNYFYSLTCTFLSKSTYIFT